MEKVVASAVAYATAEISSVCIFEEAWGVQRKGMGSPEKDTEDCVPEDGQSSTERTDQQAATACTTKNEPLSIPVEVKPLVQGKIQSQIQPIS